MLKPYIARITAPGSGYGKTMVGTEIVRKLVERGYRVGVVKHAAAGIDIDERDSARYLYAGASVVVASSPRLGAIYVASWIDDLSKAIKYISTPIVVVEGFRNVRGVDTVVIVRSSSDLDFVKSIDRPIAIVDVVGLGIDRYENVDVFTMDRIDRVVDLIEQKAIDYLLSQLPAKNCGLCGFSTCRGLVYAYLRGEPAVCPHLLDVELKIDNRAIPLNPFVKSVIKNVAVALARSLKGVPKDFRRLEIRISLG